MYCTLGGITLDWEPEALSYAVGARIIQHDLVGGGRAFDVMGDDPGPMTLSGRLTGANMNSQRDQLSALRGTATNLVVGSDSYPVLVKEAAFEPVWGLLTYRITLLVQTNSSSASSAPTPAQNAAASVSQANALATPASISTPVAQASAILANSSADPSTALPYLASASTAANSAISSSTATIAANVGIDQVSGQSVAQFTQGWASLVAAYQVRAAASQASALIAGATIALQG